MGFIAGLASGGVGVKCLADSYDLANLSGVLNEQKHFYEDIARENSYDALKYLSQNLEDTCSHSFVEQQLIGVNYSLDRHLETADQYSGFQQRRLANFYSNKISELMNDANYWQGRTVSAGFVCLIISTMIFGGVSVSSGAKKSGEENIKEQDGEN